MKKSSELCKVLIESVSDEQFEKFSLKSKKGDRNGMIETLLEVPSIRDVLQIAESFKQKNNKVACEFYKKYKDGETLSDKLLTIALFAADQGASEFEEILVKRAKHNFNAGNFDKCTVDCEYYLQHFEKDSKNGQAVLSMISNCRKKTRKTSDKRTSNSKNGTPRIAGKINRLFPNCSDLTQLVASEDKGRHLVTNCDIKVGSVIIVDQPFAFCTNQNTLATHCLHCHKYLITEGNNRIPCYKCQTVSFCSAKCLAESWTNYHQFECPIFDYLYETDDNVNNSKSQLLLAFRTAVKVGLDNNWQSSESVESDENELSIEKMVTHCSSREPSENIFFALRAIIVSKCLVHSLSNLEVAVVLSRKQTISLAASVIHYLLAIDCNGYEIVENVLNHDTRIWEPRSIGGALYPSVTLVNHSCYPNVVRHTYPNGAVVVRAIRCIPKGSELLDCYGPHFVSDDKASRAKYLSKKYRFVCNCEACVGNWTWPLPDCNEFLCKSCNRPFKRSSVNCEHCNAKLETEKLQKKLEASVRKRAEAAMKIYKGNYEEALPLLFEHALFIDKVLVAPSVEAIKTQQSIIQCFNSLGCVAK